MKTRSHNGRMAVETLEARSLMSAVAYADFNNDGRLDKAVVTNSTTITVSLANKDGSYTVSAIITTPKNQPVSDVAAQDIDGDGYMDINAGGMTKSGSFVFNSWRNNGDGTFTYIEPFKWKPHNPNSFF
jgi:hypothetical protein